MASDEFDRVLATARRATRVAGMTHDQLCARVCALEAERDDLRAHRDALYTPADTADLLELRRLRATISRVRAVVGEDAVAGATAYGSAGASIIASAVRHALEGADRG